MIRKEQIIFTKNGEIFSYNGNDYTDKDEILEFCLNHNHYFSESNTKDYNFKNNSYIYKRNIRIEGIPETYNTSVNINAINREGTLCVLVEDNNYLYANIYDVFNNHDDLGFNDTTGKKLSDINFNIMANDSNYHPYIETMHRLVMTRDIDNKYYFKPTLIGINNYKNEDAPTTKVYQKVRSTNDIIDGLYLIVHENKTCILDGTLTTDVANNFKTVEIGEKDGEKYILSNDNTNVSAFNIKRNNQSFTIMNNSGSGHYIYHSDGNSISFSTSSEQNMIEIEDDGNCIIKYEDGYQLKYNSSANRFRYYAATSQQGEIQLYKLVEVETFAEILPKNKYIYSVDLPELKIDNFITEPISNGLFELDTEISNMYSLVFPYKPFFYFNTESDIDEDNYMLNITVKNLNNDVLNEIEIDGTSSGKMCIIGNIESEEINSEPDPEKEEMFVKIIEEQDDWSGTYLIVWEESAEKCKVFNGSITDIKNNNGLNIDADIINNTISLSDETVGETLRKAAFTISKNNSGDSYSIKTYNNVYIGYVGTSTSGQLDTSTDPEYFINKISFEDGHSKIITAERHDLQYNNLNSNTLFRYYTTAQKPIQLYKLETVTKKSAEAINFIVFEVSALVDTDKYHVANNILLEIR